MKINHGLVHVYTGSGKGKTTASLGLALRAIGWGLKVIMIQFVKGYPNIGEMRFAERFPDLLSVRQFAIDTKRDIDPAEVASRQQTVEEAMAFAESTVASGEYDLVILDELNVALHYGLVPIDRVLRLLKGKPQGVELVVTGRNAPEQLIVAADYATEMNQLKHPYDSGVQARPGIDY